MRWRLAIDQPEALKTMSGEVRSVAKVLPEDAKLKKLRGMIVAPDASKNWNFATRNT